jgi:hypothetical protein
MLSFLSDVAAIVRSLLGRPSKLPKRVAVKPLEPMPPKRPVPVCRGCGEPFDPKHKWMSDGCPCNGRRGLNHGLVNTAVCACAFCDPRRDETR